VVLGEGPLIGVKLDMDLTEEAGASRVSQLTTPLRLRLLEGTGTVLGRLDGDGLTRTTHRDIFDAAELAAAGTALVERYLRAGTGSAAPLPVGRCSYVEGEVEVPLRASGFDRHTWRMIVEEDAAQERAWLRQDPQLEQEWLRQNNLIYGGLIAIGVYLVQPFLTTASLDLSASSPSRWPSRSWPPW
jgi:hypothetical protein